MTLDWQPYRIHVGSLVKLNSLRINLQNMWHVKLMTFLLPLICHDYTITYIIHIEALTSRSSMIIF